MSFLSDEQTASLHIERMIFHVVSPEHPEPQFLAEVKPPQCVDFFVERIRETLKGAAYVFVKGSGMPSLLREASESKVPQKFIDVSHDLAERFKDKVKQDRRLAPGVLMFLLLRTDDNEPLCAIIKYEHQQVVTYSYLQQEDGTPLTDADGNPIPNLQNLVDTFTQDKKAMQKSAVVKFGRTPDEDSVVVIDHSSGRYRDASQHFANFLDIKRLLAPTELTQRLEEAAVEVINSSPEEVPDYIRRAPKRHVRTAMSRMDGFDFEKPEEFLGSIVQGLSADSKLVKDFQSKLSRRGLATEAFRFEGTIPPSAEFRRVITNEGVAVLFRKKHEETKKVEVKEDPAGGVIITICSTGLEKDDDLERMPRLPD